MECGGFADQVVSEVLRSNTKDGFVLVRAPLHVQRIIAESRLPVVVHGSLHPSIAGVPWIERDQKQIGAILGSYLLDRGCRRIVGLFREQLAPGDFVTLDALLAAMTRAGLKPDDFVLRALPADLEAVKQAVVDILSDERRPAGVFCRNKLLAEGALKAAECQGLRLGRDVEKQFIPPRPWTPESRSRNQRRFRQFPASGAVQRDIGIQSTSEPPMRWIAA